MRIFLFGFSVAFFLGAITIGSFLFAWKFQSDDFAYIFSRQEAQTQPQKTREELIVEALERSSNIKGLYMTADVANDSGAGATRLRNHLISLAEKTEINGMVIDVKEVCGAEYDEARLASLLAELQSKNIWPIARIVVFKDASQIEAHPEWYLTRKTQKDFPDPCFRKRHLRAKSPDGEKPNVVFWEDQKGGYWLDPASEGAREYIVGIAKKMIDLGFPELQFDYIRFPSDGDVEHALYPAWDKKIPKHLVMKSFFEYLNRVLKSYKPDIILSADLFGYVASRTQDVGIGQRLEDIGENFDYISFMVYPSHYYAGFFAEADSLRGLPAVRYTAREARMHPDVVVSRSLLYARDFFDGRATGTSTVATSSVATSTALLNRPRSGVRLRPWLEDFFHEEDKAAGRPSGAEKIRLQIDAAEWVEKHGWLLWNAANLYTEAALRKE